MVRRMTSSADRATTACCSTSRGHLAETLGRVRLQDGSGALSLPPRSITTLFPAGAGPQVDEND